MAETEGEDWYRDKNAYDMVQNYVEGASEEFGVRPELINSVIHEESSFRPEKVSHKGAMGYMQILPDVAQKFGATDPLDAEQNIRAGVAYLAELLEMYDGDEAKAIQAYHMGPTAVGKGKKPGPETRKYVREVMGGAGEPETVGKMYARPKEGWKRRSLRGWKDLVR